MMMYSRNLHLLLYVNCNDSIDIWLHIVLFFFVCISYQTFHYFNYSLQVIVTAQSSFPKQVYALTERELQSTFRDTGSLITKFGTTIFLSLLFGLIFLGVGGEDNGEAKKFNAHTGAIAMIMIATMFASSDPILLSFPFERPIFLREYTTGTCKCVSVCFYTCAVLFVHMLLSL